MRMKLVLPLLLAVGGPVQAQSRDVQQYCRAIGQFARTIMQNRQAGATMADMLASKAPSPAFQELGETLITAAFSEPVAGSEELKQRAVNKFETATTKACIDTGRDS